MIKRLFDLAATIPALLILLPVLAVLALVIKMTSSGPAFFQQTRVGLRGKTFKLIKLRTMVADAPRLGSAVTSKGDPRVTSIGRLLRRTKLDELPELWNVMRGEMSLVGPRPEVPGHVKHYRPEWQRVFDVRPGITDLATLQFRDEESVMEAAQDHERAYLEVVVPIKIRLALEYVERQSLWLDIKILFITVWGITLGRFFAKPDNRLAHEAVELIKQLNQKSN